MTDMVTRVAQTISMRLYGGYPVGTNHSREIMAQWENTKALAHAAIEEMREPTEEMAKDVRERYGFLDRSSYTRLIDAALREPNEEEKRSAE